MVLSLDPFEFGGDGRAVVSFGADPYQADSVSWLVPGFATTVDKLEGNMRNALNHVQSTMREDPTLAATSIAWIGYDAPNGVASGRVLSPALARAGAEILYSDIRAFNVARDTVAGDGSRFNGNHIFGHSYGSTTVSYAGRGGTPGERRPHRDIAGFSRCRTDAPCQSIRARPRQRVRRVLVAGSGHRLRWAQSGAERSLRGARAGYGSGDGRIRGGPGHLRVPGVDEHGEHRRDAQELLPPCERGRRSAGADRILANSGRIAAGAPTGWTSKGIVGWSTAAR